MNHGRLLVDATMNHEIIPMDAYGTALLVHEGCAHGCTRDVWEAMTLEEIAMDTPTVAGRPWIMKGRIRDTVILYIYVSCILYVNAMN